MGGPGSGMNRVNPAGQFVDELEEASFALEEAAAKFDRAERLEEEAQKEIRLANDTIKNLMRRHGYQHLRELA